MGVGGLVPGGRLGPGGSSNGLEAARLSPPGPPPTTTRGYTTRYVLRGNLLTLLDLRVSEFIINYMYDVIIIEFKLTITSSVDFLNIY